MTFDLDLSSLADYDLFLRIKSLPQFRFSGRTAIVPDEYASRLGVRHEPPPDRDYVPIPGLFDYQAEITRLAIRRRKFAVFARCGLGKTMIFLEYARHVVEQLPPGQCVLIVSPLMVIDQTLSEAFRFYGDTLPIKHVPAAGLASWLTSGTSRIGITNYEAIRDGLTKGRLGSLIPDESSTMKSAYGKWGQRLIELGRGLDYKLALTGTPAPNDRIEFANHAVFLDAFPNVNSFLARFFVNRGQTDNRWELKPHALRPFYRALSHWSIFLNNPATYGWRDNVGTIPPIHVHIHDVDLTSEQRSLVTAETGRMFVTELGGITTRSKLAQISKGNHKGKKVATNKPEFIRDLVDSWPDESTIIWCIYDAEQKAMERTFPDAASIDGDTPHEQRRELIAAFQRGDRKVMISKGKVLGFGLNLQVATRHVFSGLQDSWETFHQCVMRSNRCGSTQDLNVHIPVTELERPMVDTVLRKAHRIQLDTEEQETIFNESR